MMSSEISNVAQLASGADTARSAVNTIISHPSRNLVCTGHEDGSIKIYDFEADKVTQTIAQAHSDSVSSLAISNTGLELISGSHDGSIKVWDLRKFGSSTALNEDEFVPLYEIQNAH